MRELEKEKEDRDIHAWTGLLDIFHRLVVVLFLYELCVVQLEEGYQ